MGKKFMWFRRIVLLCFALAAVLTVGAAASASEDVHDVFTASDLANMGGKSGTYYLRNDLDLTNYGNWTPITFAGTFDGQGHTIRGVVVNNPGDVDAGLFSILTGTVRNLHLEVDITGNASTSGIASYFTGGLAGQIHYGIAECVSVSGRVRGTRGTGGLVGALSGTVLNCYSAVNVSIIGDVASAGCGGLVGTAGWHWDSPVYVQNCYATGTVTIPGQIYWERRYNGLVGLLSHGTVTNSYYCNYNNSQYSGAGAYVSEEDMKQLTTYSDWDFSTVWRISQNINNGFPVLRDPAKVSPEEITLNMSTLEMEEGDALTLQANIAPMNATARNVTWASSDPSIVSLEPATNSTAGTINARIIVNAVAPGNATVRAVTEEGGLIAECEVTVSGEPAPRSPYRINRLTVRNQNGVALNAIPSESFQVTVSVTNVTSDETPVVMLASYTAEGQYVGLMYVTVRESLGATVEVTLPVENAGGRIAQLKAFVITSFADLTPLGTAVSFPAA